MTTSTFPTPGMVRAGQPIPSSVASGIPESVPSSINPLPPVSADGAAEPAESVIGGAAGAPQPGYDAGSASGGGGNSAAAARISAQIPDLGTKYLEAFGQNALNYAVELAKKIPSLGPAVEAAQAVNDCLIRYGVVAARAYVKPDLSAAGFIVVVSAAQLQQLGDIAVRCALDTAFDTGDVSGGGPGGFSPCMYRYYYDATVDGVSDRFFVIVAGTSEATYSDIYAGHLKYTLKAW